MANTLMLLNSIGDDLKDTILQLFIKIQSERGVHMHLPTGLSGCLLHGKDHQLINYTYLIRPNKLN